MNTEEIPFTNDDEAARLALARPVLRTTGPDEYIQFIVQGEEALVIEKGLYPGSYCVRLGVAPVGEDGNAAPRAPTARLELVLPIPNVEVEGHEAPDTGYKCVQYFASVDPKNFGGMPLWDKATKTWTDAQGNTVDRQTADATKQRLYSAAIKELRTRYNRIKRGEGGGFTGDLFFAQVTASKDGKYRNLKSVCGTMPSNGTQLTDGFRTTAEG